MFIRISRTGNGRYVFCVGEDHRDAPGAWLTSDGDSAVLGDLPVTYQSFGEAHSAASRLVDERPSCIMAKKATFYSRDGDDQRMIAEGDAIHHYNEQVDIVEQRLRSIIGRPAGSREELEAVRNEIEGIKGELGKMAEMSEGDAKRSFDGISARTDAMLKDIEKSNVAKTASKSTASMGLRKSAIRAFAEAAMLAVKPTHGDVFVRGGTFFPESGTHEAVLASTSGDLVRLSFDRNFLLSGIRPCQAVTKECGGGHSIDFFLKYWEPIVNAVGHFHSKTHGIVAVAGLDQSKRGVLAAFSMSDAKECSLEVGRRTVLGKRTWMMSKRAVEVTRPPNAGISVGDEVECMNESLPTYFGRTGTVDEVSKKPGWMLYRVDFRRGIGPVWLEDKSVRKVELGS